MSKKNYDNHNRWRNKTVAFRVSSEEDLQLETMVKLTGLTKQDYIIRRLLERDVVVQGNPRVYKALRDQLASTAASASNRRRRGPGMARKTTVPTAMMAAESTRAKWMTPVMRLRCRAP